MTVMSVPLSLSVSFCPCLPVFISPSLPVYSVFLLMSQQYIFKSFPNFWLASLATSCANHPLPLCFSFSFSLLLFLPLFVSLFTTFFLPLQNYLLFFSLPLQLFFWPSQSAYLSTSLTLHPSLPGSLSFFLSICFYPSCLSLSSPSLSTCLSSSLPFPPPYLVLLLSLSISLVFFACFSSSVLYQSLSLLPFLHVSFSHSTYLSLFYCLFHSF